MDDGPDGHQSVEGTARRGEADTLHVQKLIDVAVDSWSVIQKEKVHHR